MGGDHEGEKVTRVQYLVALLCLQANSALSTNLESDRADFPWAMHEYEWVRLQSDSSSEKAGARDFRSHEHNREIRPYKFVSYGDLAPTVLRMPSLVDDPLLRRPQIHSYMLPRDFNIVAAIGELVFRRNEYGFVAASNWWVNQVCGGCEWDFKNARGLQQMDRQALEPFGNYWFGLTGSALGLNSRFLDLGAGAVSIYDHGLQFGLECLGDDCRDWHRSHEGIGNWESGAWKQMLPDLLPSLASMSDEERRYFGIFGAAEQIAILEYLRVRVLTYLVSYTSSQSAAKRRKQAADADRRDVAAGKAKAVIEIKKEERAKAAANSRREREYTLSQRDELQRRNDAKRPTKPTIVEAPPEAKRHVAPTEQPRKREPEIVVPVQML